MNLSDRRAFLLGLFLTVAPASAFGCLLLPDGSPCYDEEPRPAFDYPSRVQPIPVGTDIAGRSWTEYVAVGTALAVTEIDREQTIGFRRRGKHEQNTLLGQEPTEARVNLGVALAMAGGVWAWTSIQQERDRWLFLAAWVAVETWAVGRNAQRGFHARAPLLNLTF